MRVNEFRTLNASEINLVLMTTLTEVGSGIWSDQVVIRLKVGTVVLRVKWHGSKTVSRCVSVQGASDRGKYG